MPEHELVQRPNDPTIPRLLFDDSAETQLLSRGQFHAAHRVREHRKHLYGVWLVALQHLKLEIPDVRPLGFGYPIFRSLLLLRLAGFLHFSGISKRLDRKAVDAARRMANLATVRAY